MRQKRPATEHVGDVSEASAQSFIVRVWIEETAQEAGETIWRGYVMHVPSGERHYVQTLGEIGEFIRPFLETPQAPG